MSAPTWLGDDDDDLAVPPGHDRPSLAALGRLLGVIVTGMMLIAAMAVAAGALPW